MSKRSTEEEKLKALELRKTGMTYIEVAAALGNRSVAWVRNVCVQNGTDTATIKAARDEEMRAYKSQGHSRSEVARKFGVSEGYAATVCKGIAPQKSVRKGEHPAWLKNQYTNGTFDREANAKRYVDERTPWFEYEGGFTHIDGYIDLRCKKCGSIQHRSMVSVRRGTASCDNCRDIEAKQRQEAKAKAEEERRRQRAERHEELVRLKAEKAKERAEVLATKKHPCVICGAETTNDYCCSEACSKKRNDQLKETKRRIKVQQATIDRGITLQRVYKKDNGVCYICGGMCDWGDKEERTECIVCGNNYPSIDHVIPLAAGGKHEWDNVRLAHRICNSKKAASISPRYVNI